MDKVEIEGVRVIPLKQIIDNRGAVYHVFRNNDHDVDVEEVYISRVNSGVTKGWKQHLQSWQRLIISFGQMEIVLYDNRENSLTKGIFKRVLLDTKENYARLEIPPKIWYAFRCISDDYALMINISEIIHDDGEINNISIGDDSIHYEWE